MAGLGVRSSRKGKGRALVNSFGFAHFKAVMLAKCPAFPRKKEALASGNKLTERLQKAIPTSVVLGWVLCSASISVGRFKCCKPDKRKHGGFPQPLHFNVADSSLGQHPFPPTMLFRLWKKAPSWQTCTQQRRQKGAKV